MPDSTHLLTPPHSSEALFVNVPTFPKLRIPLLLIWSQTLIYNLRVEAFRNELLQCSRVLYFNFSHFIQSRRIGLRIGLWLFPLQPVCLCFVLYYQLFISFILPKSLSTFTGSLALVNRHAHVSPSRRLLLKALLCLSPSLHCQTSSKGTTTANHFQSLQFTHILLLFLQ